MKQTNDYSILYTLTVCLMGTIITLRYAHISGLDGVATVQRLFAKLVAPNKRGGKANKNIEEKQE